MGRFRSPPEEFKQLIELALAGPCAHVGLFDHAVKKSLLAVRKQRRAILLARSAFIR